MHCTCKNEDESDRMLAAGLHLSFRKGISGGTTVSLGTKRELMRCSKDLWRVEANIPRSIMDL